MYIEINDYRIPPTFDFSTIPFTNAGLDKELIEKEIEKIEYVNTVYLGGFNGNCEVTLYRSCFNKSTIEKVVNEIEQRLNDLLGNEKYRSYSNLSEQDYYILFEKTY